MYSVAFILLIAAFVFCSIIRVKFIIKAAKDLRKLGKGIVYWLHSLMFKSKIAKSRIDLIDGTREIAVIMMVVIAQVDSLLTTRIINTIKDQVIKNLIVLRLWLKTY